MTRMMLRLLTAFTMLAGYRMCAAQAGEAIMLALRTAEGVDLRRFRERYGVDVRERYRETVGDLVAAGVLAADETRLRLTERGRFVANDVCGAFLAD